MWKPPTGKRAERAMDALNWMVSAGKKSAKRAIARKFKVGDHCKLIRDMRSVAVTSPYNLTCGRDSPRKPWLYWVTAVPEEDKERLRHNLLQEVARMHTDMNINSSFVLALKGNTREGKQIRALKAHIEAAIAELALVE